MGNWSRRATRSIGSLLGLVVVAAAACGGGGGGHGDGGPGTGGIGGGAGGAGGMLDPAFTTFCMQARAAAVARVQACNGLAPEIAQKVVTVDPCVAWAPSVTGGRMQFDASADAAACITALQTLACDADQSPSACDRVLWGLRTAGQSCNLIAQLASFSECEAGSLCVPSPGGCQGTCVKGALLTQACGGSQPCVQGETCSLATGTCTTRGASGDACGFDSIIACEQGLHCSDLFGGTCIADLPPGGACSGQPLECAPPGVCDRGLALTGTCRVPPKPGDACVIGNFECSIGLEYCGADSKCHALPSIGDPCNNTDGEVTTCMFGMCDTTAATPVCKKVAAGDPCTSTADCTSGALCVPSASGSYSVCSAVCL
jgi:hypothetical protein